MSIFASNKSTEVPYNSRSLVLRQSINLGYNWINPTIAKVKILTVVAKIRRIIINKRKILMRL